MRKEKRDWIVWDPVFLTKYKRLRNYGLNNTLIAERLGVSYESLRKGAYRHGLFSETQAIKRPWSAAELLFLWDQREKGQTIRQIARKLHRSHHLVEMKWYRFRKSFTKIRRL